MIAGGSWGCQEKWRQSEAHGRAGGPPLSPSPSNSRGPRPRGAAARRQPRGHRPAVLFVRFRLRVRVRRLGRYGGQASRSSHRRAGSTPALLALVGGKETLAGNGSCGCACSWNGMHWPCFAYTVMKVNTTGENENKHYVQACSVKIHG